MRPSGVNTNPEPVPPASILTTDGPTTSTAVITAREYESIDSPDATSVASDSLRTRSIDSRDATSVASRSLRTSSFPTSDFDDAKSQPSLHRFGAGRHSKLPEDRCEMKLHRVLANGEAAGDIAVRQPVGHECEHVMLARRQRFDGRILLRRPVSPQPIWTAVGEGGLAPRKPIVLVAGEGRQREHGFGLLGEIDDLEMRVGRDSRAQRGGGPPKINA